ncbi:Sensor histidine kinase ChvG [Rhodovulum sp. PH10]|uniref:sensor histidine kinase n=1 Tax=Rhodovulum sp. PH10 TaxID=1187851 RepID=UPI00027C24FC|nr:sensor histidine kinase [Rhodovulum sp. PH10]EJW12305.1 Sensor histidine kinase ChvG [Rhodovulum sp. PH10]
MLDRTAETDDQAPPDTAAPTDAASDDARASASEPAGRPGGTAGAGLAGSRIGIGGLRRIARIRRTAHRGLLRLRVWTSPLTQANQRTRQKIADAGRAVGRGVARVAVPVSRVLGLNRLGRLLWPVWSLFTGLTFSSLSRRIVFLNVAGLLALVLGILYLTQFRAGLIDARVHSLLVQGEIISGAIASSATVDMDTITIDPQRLLELQAGESYGPSDDVLFGYEFPLNPEQVAPLLRRLVTPINIRARIYDREGVLFMDSRNFIGRGDVLRYDLPPPTAEEPGLIERGFTAIRRWLGRGDLPRYRELGPEENGRAYPEVAQALAGQKASVVRIDSRGNVIVSVAVPIQRSRVVRGALLLSTQGGEIDQIVEAERLAIMKVFLIAAGIMFVLSLLLAGTIAGPVRRLADAAERVRRRIKSRVEIPDFTRRKDEIGHLSGALRDMTNALYSRIEAIESFAADVAHELKNPLTSLRSAAETLPRAKSPDSQARLLAVIEHDVKRLDRLISDISDASRLDAELQRNESGTVDLRRLLTTVVAIANEVKRGKNVTVKLAFEGGGPRSFQIAGHDSRLGQVVHNLVDNARSFSPDGGTVKVTCRRHDKELEINVDDEGPGIRPDALEKVFQRFYTDRPEQGFGQNSGLGLSISKQIVEAHGGRIWAENRMGPDPGEGEPAPVMGARFVVRLPAM